jgi:hypothetical protein
MKNKVAFYKRKALMIPAGLVLVAGLTLAIMVHFLSNPVTLNLQIQQNPLSLTYMDGNTSQNVSIYAGSSFVVTTNLTNRANNPIEGFVTEINMSAEDYSDLTKEYLTSIVWSNQTGYYPIPDSSVCLSGDGKSIFIDVGLTNPDAGLGSTIPEETTLLSNVTITMNQSVVGNYTASAQVINADSRMCQ